MFLAELIFGDHELDLGGHVLDVDEPEFAGVAFEHHAASDADGFAIGAGFFRAEGADFGDGAVVVEALAVGIVSQVDDVLEFFETGDFEAVLFGHDQRLFDTEGTEDTEKYEKGRS